MNRADLCGQIVEWSPAPYDHRFGRFPTKKGEGATKIVYEAVDMQDGNYVAWNEVPTLCLTPEERERVNGEVEVLKQVRHERILELFAAWSQPDRIVFITAIVESGDLQRFYRTHRVKLKVIKKWCRQILEGLCYLHSFEPPIIHRDIKCENLLFNAADGTVRIGDLGLSTRVAITAACEQLSVLGTPGYIAPEMYDGRYSETVDVYAFGMCVLEMTTRRLPYDECSNAAQIYRRVSQGVLPEAFSTIRSSAVRDFIAFCISLRPDGSRPSAEEVAAHPFLVDDGMHGEEGDDEDLIWSEGVGSTALATPAEAPTSRGGGVTALEFENDALRSRQEGSDGAPPPRQAASPGAPGGDDAATAGSGEQIAGSSSADDLLAIGEDEAAGMSSHGSVGSTLHFAPEEPYGRMVGERANGSVRADVGGRQRSSGSHVRIQGTSASGLSLQSDHSGIAAGGESSDMVGGGDEDETRMVDAAGWAEMLDDDDGHARTRRRDSSVSVGYMGGDHLAPAGESARDIGGSLSSLVIADEVARAGEHERRGSGAAALLRDDLGGEDHAASFSHAGLRDGLDGTVLPTHADGEYGPGQSVHLNDSARGFGTESDPSGVGHYVAAPPELPLPAPELATRPGAALVPAFEYVYSDGATGPTLVPMPLAQRGSSAEGARHDRDPALPSDAEPGNPAVSMAPILVVRGSQAVSGGPAVITVQTGIPVLASPGTATAAEALVAHAAVSATAGRQSGTGAAVVGGGRLRASSLSAESQSQPSAYLSSVSEHADLSAGSLTARAHAITGLAHQQSEPGVRNSFLIEQPATPPPVVDTHPGGTPLGTPVAPALASATVTPATSVSVSVLTTPLLDPRRNVLSASTPYLAGMHAPGGGPSAAASAHSRLGVDLAADPMSAAGGRISDPTFVVPAFAIGGEGIDADPALNSAPPNGLIPFRSGDLAVKDRRPLSARVLQSNASGAASSVGAYATAEAPSAPAHANPNVTVLTLAIEHDPQDDGAVSRASMSFEFDKSNVDCEQTARDIVSSLKELRTIHIDEAACVPLFTAFLATQRFEPAVTLFTAPIPKWNWRSVRLGPMLPVPTESEPETISAPLHALPNLPRQMHSQDTGITYSQPTAGIDRDQNETLNALPAENVAHPYEPLPPLLPQAAGAQASLTPHLGPAPPSPPAADYAVGAALGIPPLQLDDHALPASGDVTRALPAIADGVDHSLEPAHTAAMEAHALGTPPSNGAAYAYHLPPSGVAGGQDGELASRWPQSDGTQDMEHDRKLDHTADTTSGVSQRRLRLAVLPERDDEEEASSGSGGSADSAPRFHSGPAPWSFSRDNGAGNNLLIGPRSQARPSAAHRRLYSGDSTDAVGLLNASPSASEAGSAFGESLSYDGVSVGWAVGARGLATGSTLPSRGDAEGGPGSFLFSPMRSDISAASGSGASFGAASAPDMGADKLTCSLPIESGTVHGDAPNPQTAATMNSLGDVDPSGPTEPRPRTETVQSSGTFIVRSVSETSLSGSAVGSPISQATISAARPPLPEGAQTIGQHYDDRQLESFPAVPV